MNIADYGGIENVHYTRLVQYICEAAIDLTQKYSANDITVKMIATEAEVSKQTIYNYFPDKYAIFNYIFNRDMEKRIKNKSIKDILTLCIPNAFTENLAYYQSIANLSAHNSFHNFLFTYILNLFDETIRKTWKPDEITMDIRFAMEIYAEATCNCFTSFLRGGNEAKNFTIYELAQYMYNAVPASISKAFLQ